MLTQVTSAVFANSNVYIRHLTQEVLDLINSHAGSGLFLKPRHNTNTATGTSNVFFVTLGGNTAVTVNNVQVFLNGVDQWPTTDFIYNSSNDTIQITDAVVPAATNVHIVAWTT